MGLKFEITVDNTDLKRKLQESRQAIINSRVTAEAESAKIEKAFRSMTNGMTLEFQNMVSEATKASSVIVAIMQEIAKSADIANLPIEKSMEVLSTFVSEQKKYLSEAESNIKRLEKARSQASSKEEGQNLAQQLVVAKEDYQEQKTQGQNHSEELKELEDRYVNATSAIETLNILKSKLEKDIATLSNADGTVSPQNIAKLDELKQKYEEVEAAIVQLNKEKQSLASDASAQITGIINGIQGLTGALAAVQGIASLFGNDNEKLAAIQKNLQKIMSIATGLQQASDTLSATSAFRIETVTKATNLWKSAQVALNTQLGLSAGLSKVLMIGGVGLLIGGIAALVSWYQKWKEKQEEVNALKEQFKNIEIETAKSMAGEIVKTKALISTAENHNNSLEIRRSAIEKLNQLMPKYNGYINKEGNLIADNIGTLEDYVNLLYKVEKAKRLMTKVVDIEEQYAELSKKGSRKPTFLEEVQMGFLNMVGADWTKVLEKKSGEWAGQLAGLQENKQSFESELQALLSDSSVFSALFGSDRNRHKLTGKEHDISSEILKTKQERENIYISSIKDEGERVRKQIQVEYQRQMDEVEKQENEWKGAKNKTLTQDQQTWVTEKKGLAEDTRTSSLTAQSEKEQNAIDNLLAKYQDYTRQREEIELKFGEDIGELRTRRNDALLAGDKDQVDQFTRAIAKATADAGQELMTFDFNVLKESPEYVRAFANLKNTSSETLNSLLAQLEEHKANASDVLDPAKLNEYSGVIKQIIDELASRDVFKALSNSQLELAKANNKLAQAKINLKKAQDSGNQEEINKATKEYEAALDGVRGASNGVVKAQKEVSEHMNKLFAALSNVGNTIGGTAGEIIGFIGDIGKFVMTSIEGVQMVSKAGATAISTIEKASVILAIISAAIQLIQKLGSLVGDSHDDYLKYAEKIKDINKLTKAVNEYAIAVTKAKQEEEGWFAENNLLSLKQAKELNNTVYDAYISKLTEAQATYQNKSGGGWLTKISKAGQWLFDKVSFQWLLDDVLGTDIQGGFMNLIEKQYEKGTTAAFANLRIETRKAKKGLFGSGIGGKSQKTEDLQTWINNNKDKFGGLDTNLFDEKGFINTKLAQSLIDNYSNKLVGQTQETLEALIKLKEQHDEYLKQLREYVSSLYEPLVDNFVDSLWDWFDEGKNALDSFKDHASQTFRDIVSDMMRTIILDKVLDGFDNDIADLYEKYASGSITSEQDLMNKVADRTQQLINSYERQIPDLQNIMSVITGSLESIGLDLKNNTTESSREASTKGVASMSQESADELNGRFTAIQYTSEQIRQSTGAIQLDVANLKWLAMSTGETLVDLRDIGVESVIYLKEISRNTNELFVMNERLGTMEGSLRSVKTSLDDINLKGITIKK